MPKMRSKRPGAALGFGLALGLGVVGAVAVTLASPAARAGRRVEEPSYVVEASFGDFEVREYAPRIVAETVVRARPGEAGNRAFRILADYIFGNNTDRTSIDMTAPVGRSLKIDVDPEAPVTEARRDDAPVGEAGADGDPPTEWVVTFTMPSRWTMDTLPRPNDDRVRLRQLPRQCFAAARFRGAPGPDVVARREAALLDAVRDAGLTPDGPTIYARYDPPWVPGILRRNELLVPLAPKPE